MPLPPPFPDPSRPVGAWTLATYNVQDLFDTEDAPGSRDECPSENQLRNKLTRLGRVLHILDADVVGLMEVETLGVLERLNRDALAGLGYAHAVLIEGNDPERGIDVALLSRFPVVRVVSHAADALEMPGVGWRRVFSRDCLECHVSLPDGQTAALLVNHFKSKRGGTDETGPLRAAQAHRVRAIADALLPACPLLAVLGDLNDTPDSAPLRTLTAMGGLTDIAADVPEAHRYTFVHAGQPERIDYLLASPALGRRFVRGSAFIPHDTWAKRASDHYPLRAAFALGSATPPAGAVNLTVRYDADHPPVRRGQGPLRINAARFFPQDIDAARGQTVIVTGVVRRVDQDAATGTVRLLLGHGDPARAFAVAVPAEDRDAFGDAGIGDIAGYYGGKMTQGVGRLGFPQGRPEIAARTPRQFRIVAPKETQTWP